jgi:hypothetical protein
MQADGALRPKKVTVLVVEDRLVGVLSLCGGR